VRTSRSFDVNSASVITNNLGLTPRARKDLLDCDESTRAKKISEDQEKERDLEDTRFQAELGLRYALVNSR
jgi:hypothetical protein